MKKYTNLPQEQDQDIALPCPILAQCASVSAPAMTTVLIRTKSAAVMAVVVSAQVQSEKVWIEMIAYTKTKPEFKITLKFANTHHNTL